MISNQQIKYIQTIRPHRLRKDEAAWRDLIAVFTGDRQKTSLKDLNFDQANDLIRRLGGRPYYDDNWGLFNKTDPQHRQVLSLLYQIGWTTHHYLHGAVPDTRHLSNWLKSKKAPVRKPLMKMTTAELTKTINALEMINYKKRY